MGWGTVDGHHLTGGRSSRRTGQRTRLPELLGLFYTAITTYCGFAANGGEGTLMGLAPYGEPHFADEATRCFSRASSVPSSSTPPSSRSPRTARWSARARTTPGPTTPEGGASHWSSSMQMLLRQLSWCSRSGCWTWPTRRNDDGLLATRPCRGRPAPTASPTLGSGRRDRSRTAGIQPAAGDSGNALGAALWVAHHELGHRRSVGDDAMASAALGPSYDPDVIARGSWSAASNTSDWAKGRWRTASAAGLPRERWWGGSRARPSLFPGRWDAGRSLLTLEAQELSGD